MVLRSTTRLRPLPARLGRHSSSGGHSNGRGHPVMVTVRQATILDPITEGVSLAAEGEEFGRRVESRTLGWDLDLYYQAVRWQAICQRYGAEMKRLAALVG